MQNIFTIIHLSNSFIFNFIFLYFGDLMTDIINALNFRYATKEFDSSKKISDTDFDELLEVLRLTPSSYGIQPWKFLVIENKYLREKIMKSAWGQKQVVDADKLIVFCAKKNLSVEDIDEFIEFTASQRGISKENLDGLKNMLTSTINNISKENLIEWNKKQLYIALGFLMQAAAIKGIDTCPMEGFLVEEVDKILDLENKNLTTACICPVGYRSENDKYANMKKIRYPKEKVIETI